MPDSGAPAQDGGANGDASSDASTALPLHCNAPMSSPDLCVENAQGHAGDVVSVDIYYVGTSSCSDAYEASGHLVADGSDFQLANPVQQVNCVSRDYYAAPAPGTIEIIWNAFGGGSIGSCPNDLVPGKLDTVQIEILPGTPPGDYPITWNNASLPAPTQACSAFGNGVSGFIRVLPV